MICFSIEKMCESSPRSHGLLLRPVHGGLVTGTGRRDLAGRRRDKAAADRARWECNMGVDGANQCEEWEGGVETVL
jgi:hypothetical protein